MAASVSMDLQVLPKETILDGQKDVYILTNRLPVTAINISERCLFGCNFCCNDSKPNGRQMSAEMFDALTESDHVLFTSSEPVFLGDGEVLIWEDKTARKDFSYIVKKLVCELGLRVQFTTAGLVSSNLELGMRAVEAFPLFPYSRVGACVSFNLLNPDAKRDREAYLQAIRQTFELLLSKRIIVTALLMCDRDNFNETFHALVDTVGRRDIGYRSQILSPNGRALLHYNFQHLGPMSSNVNSCDVADCHVPNSFGVMTTGEVFPSCTGMGRRGATFGNVLVNDVSQIDTLYREFLTEFVPRKRNRPCGIEQCEFHRTWDKRFEAPRSENPVVRLRRTS